MQKRDEPCDMISPAKFDRGYTQKRTITLKLGNFRKFVNGPHNVIRKSAPVLIGEFSWKLIAKILQQDGIQWLTLFLSCRAIGDSAKTDWSLVTECNIKTLSQRGDINTAQMFYHSFSQKGRLSKGYCIMQCEKLLDKSNGYIQNDAIDIEAWVTINFPVGFKFWTMDSTTIFKWPIFNFKTAATRLDPNNLLSSNDFSIGKRKFVLQFDPTNIAMNESRDYCSLWLIARDLGVNESIGVRYKLWIENTDGEKIVDNVFGKISLATYSNFYF